MEIQQNIKFLIKLDLLMSWRGGTKTPDTLYDGPKSVLDSSPTVIGLSTTVNDANKSVIDSNNMSFNWSQWS